MVMSICFQSILLDNDECVDLPCEGEDNRNTFCLNSPGSYKCVCKLMFFTFHNIKKIINNYLFFFVSLLPYAMMTWASQFIIDLIITKTVKPVYKDYQWVPSIAVIVSRSKTRVLSRAVLQGLQVTFWRIKSFTCPPHVSIRAEKLLALKVGQ